jgi:hypothetical protein
LGQAEIAFDHQAGSHPSVLVDGEAA